MTTATLLVYLCLGVGSLAVQQESCGADGVCETQAGSSLLQREVAQGTFASLSDRVRLQQEHVVGKGLVTLAETKECKSNSTSCECFVSRDANFCSTCPGVNCATCQEYCFENPVKLQEGPCSQDTTTCACFRHRDSNFCSTCPHCGECSEYCAQDWQWVGSGDCNWYTVWMQLGRYNDLGVDVPACLAKCEAEKAGGPLKGCNSISIHTWMEGAKLHGDCFTYWMPSLSASCPNNTNSIHHYFKAPQ